MDISFGKIELDSGLEFKVGINTFSFSNTSNYVLGPLTYPPYSISEAQLSFGGLVQIYSQDFTVREVLGGTDPGYYVCVSTASSAPGGGVFNGGTNPGTGLSSYIEVGDILTIAYPVII